MGFSSVLITIGHYIGVFLGATWWFILFLLLVPMTRSMFLAWRQKLFEHHDLKWAFMEIKIPRETLRTPRAMDQVFQTISTFRNAPGDLGEKYHDGEVTRWYTLEMVSFEGELHFYFRCYKKQVPLVHAAFQSFYPDLELIEVPDYTEKLPHTYADLNAQGLELWGSEMLLNESPAYPIKTYTAFEVPEENMQVDPMGAFMEVLNKLKPGEFVGVQYHIQPEPRDWREHYEEEAEKLKKPKREKAGSDEFGFPLMIPRSPGETDVIKAMETNFSKPAFKCVVRFIYVSPKNIFYDSFPRRGIIGSFNQYASSDLNSFGQNFNVSTRVKFWHYPYLFPNLRVKLRCQRLLHDYLHREMGVEEFMGRFVDSHPLSWYHSKEIILNTESLATLWHPPTMVVMTGPLTPRIESRKGGAPSGLPIYGDEKELEQFK